MKGGTVEGRLKHVETLLGETSGPRVVVLATPYDEEMSGADVTICGDLSAEQWMEIYGNRRSLKG